MNAFKTADILLPKYDSEQMKKWAVVACDQYTSEPEYWNDVAAQTNGTPSTLDLILPEAFLSETEQRIPKINAKMTELLESGFFAEYKDCFVLVKRTQADGRLRAGLVGAIDLEEYDYRKGSKSLVRATEATVAERIPPRVKIRTNAPLELPHIMILIDDIDNTVIEPLLNQNLPELYNFDMMKNGGHIEGLKVDGEAAKSVCAALDKLADKQAFNAKYGLSDEEVLLFAMGDGNHSLATAKECYEQKKREGSPDAELARYALVELVNLHSPALEFEAIHRVVTGVDYNDLLDTMTNSLGLTTDTAEQRFTLISGDKMLDFGITKPTSNLTVGSLQSFLDKYLSEHKGEIDYIHGEDTVRNLCKDGGIGFLLPSMKKSELFPTVIKDGALPRKTFSMGHAHDKRFYVEARRIRK
ncbi:MAG: DUF1015 domain-containing protein [Oscillospiraceae bacterium]